MISDDLHEPLEQGFIITKRAAGNALAKRFADYFGSRQARAVLTKYGFLLSEERTPRKVDGCATAVAAASASPPDR